RCNIDAGGGVRVVGEVALNLRGRTVGKLENSDVRPAASARAGNNVGQAAPGGVPGSDADAAGEGRVVGEEAHQTRAILAAEDRHIRTAAGIRAADDIGEAVAVDIPGGHVDAASKVHVVGEELPEELPGGAIVDVNVRSTARPRRGDDVGEAVAVHVPHGDTDAAGEFRVIGEERLHEVVREGVEENNVWTAAGVGACRD